MEEAERRFNAKLQRQSKTLDGAVTEYRRRYKREPPKDFDKWWDFVQKYNVTMVDEYDILMEDLGPFYELSGEEIRRRVDHVSFKSVYCRELANPLTVGRPIALYRPRAYQKRQHNCRKCPPNGLQGLGG